MKNVILFFLLILIVAINSCKDKNNGDDGFQPSLNLDEYVLINVNGTERIFTTENDIDAREDINPNGDRSLRVFLSPIPLTFTHFILEIDDPALGDFTGNEVDINYLEYPFDNEFQTLQLSCHATDCVEDINLTIYELGVVGEKIIGEMSGVITNNGEASEFTGEFVIYRDE